MHPDQQFSSVQEVPPGFAQQFKTGELIRPTKAGKPALHPDRWLAAKRAHDEEQVSAVEEWAAAVRYYDNKRRAEEENKTCIWCGELVDGDLDTHEAECTS